VFGEPARSRVERPEQNAERAGGELADCLYLSFSRRNKRVTIPEIRRADYNRTRRRRDVYKRESTIKRVSRIYI